MMGDESTWKISDFFEKLLKEGMKGYDEEWKLCRFLKSRPNLFGMTKTQVWCIFNFHSFEQQVLSSMDDKCWKIPNLLFRLQENGIKPFKLDISLYNFLKKMPNLFGMAPLPMEQTYVWNAKKNNIDILCPALSTNQNFISNTSQMDVKIEKDEKVPAEIEIKEEFPKDEEISMDYLTNSSPISSTNSNQTKSVELSKMLGGRLTNKKQNYWLAAGGTALLKGAAAPTDPTALQTAVKMAKKDTKHHEDVSMNYQPDSSAIANASQINSTLSSSMLNPTDDFLVDYNSFWTKSINKPIPLEILSKCTPLGCQICNVGLKSKSKHLAFSTDKQTIMIAHYNGKRHQIHFH